ncbi:hypothetical protein C6P46_005071 [Rhodotorula mucilaginosa]|uniref:Telomerase reverse transcriptase n=1 Tax=Rhodotorula mucilaginosa TaxID=5537 RepID=A0A9P6VYR8_RHOMI|nr:hypothetical protein C6P46_005071 [Rhodotorula mucilaginosa]
MMNEPIDPPTAPEPVRSSSYTHKLLQKYYSTVSTLRDLLPPERRDHDDSESFRRLVGETVVASRAPAGPPRLDAASVGQGANGASMPEVSPPLLFRAPDGVLFSRNLQTHSLPFPLAQIIEQVQQRLFAAHAREYYRERKAGNVAFATPKNMLAFGYRLNTERTRDLQRTRSQLEQGFVEVFPNTIVATLVSSRNWDLLASRTGPDWLIELFSSPDTALFLPLPNACLMQISGTPVADLKMLQDLQTNTKRGSRRTEHAPRKRKRRQRRKREDEEEEEELLPALEGRPSEAGVLEEGTPPAPPTLATVPEVRIDGPTDSNPQLTPRRESACPALGKSRSLPQLGDPTLTTIGGGVDLANKAGSLAPNTSVSPTKRSLRATTSAASVLGGGAGGGAAESSGRPAKQRRLETLHSNNAIVLARHQMYHHRLSKGVGGKLPYGLSSRHVLVRLPTLYSIKPVQHPKGTATSATRGSTEAAARHLAKYIFPRQFGLHNAFTSPKARVSVDVLPDYTDRELEIKRLGSIKTPPRLRPVLPILQRLGLLSSRCNFRKLLDKRCPSKLKRRQLSQEERSAIFDLSANAEPPRTQVSRGEVSLDTSHPSLVIPHGQTQAVAQNVKKPKLSEYACTIYEVECYLTLTTTDVSQLLRYRRYESVSLHALLQGFSVLDCEWLSTKNRSSKAGPVQQQRSTAADMGKRLELLSEFMYWFFDSFIIDLVRTSFYVTDTATHQNRPLYFRQDDWTALCAPLLKQLGDSVFEKVPLVSPFRSLNGIRAPAGGRREVGQPINKILQGVFDVLTFEAKRKPHLTGSLVVDPQQIYAKLRLFKKDLLARHGGDKLPKLYFVKVDVRAAYDTIQQDKLLQIVEAVLEETMYWIQRYSQVSPVAGSSLKSFKRVACTDGELGLFEDLAIKLAQDVHNIILSDSVAYTNVGRDRLLQLLREHITTNLVKVSGRLYRQKTGIPQGSILSSLLCSLFYGDMEKTRLSFTAADESSGMLQLLMRYVDDFLFVTTDVGLASRFLRVMHAGIPEYGCAISPEKRLTNFDICLDEGEVVPPLAAGEDFPWCGVLIDTKTLEVRFGTVASERDVFDQLTIQRYRKPGRAFLVAMFRAVKIRSRIMYVDTAHNSPSTAYANVYRGLLVVALKFQAYVQEWGIDARRKSSFLYNNVQQVVAFQWSAIVNQARSVKARALGAEMTLRRNWVIWLGLHAFHRVLSRRPAVYSPLLKALARDLRGSMYGGARVHLQKVVGHASTAFADRGNGERKARMI